MKARLRALTLGCLLGVAGCYEAALGPLQNGQLGCSADGRCPLGFHCAVDHSCWRDGQDPGGDGPPPVEMSVPDLSGLDLRGTEAGVEDLSIPDLGPDLGPDLIPGDAAPRDEGGGDPPDLGPCGGLGGRCCPGSVCNVGCCAGGACVAGTAPAACGGKGAMCEDCAGNPAGHACVVGACGCNLAAECPQGKACGANHVCAVACDVNTTLCNGGCCAAGSCVAGTDGKACGGGGGQCADCSADPMGGRCVAGLCGCTGVVDCPMGSACDIKAGRCGRSCAGNLPCSGGCCDGNQCVGGVGDAACGADGKACLDCKLVSAQCSPAGRCDVCLAGRGNCDNVLQNGCETSTLSDPLHCGAGGPMNLGCLSPCSGVNVPMTVCSAGVCAGNCAVGFADCNGSKQLDGCEAPVSSDPDNCGVGGATGPMEMAGQGLQGAGCRVKCSTSNMATRTCAQGVCSGACVMGFADCNGDKLVDGCETNLMSGDVLNCGACKQACSTNHYAAACSGGNCSGTCNVGFADCDVDLRTNGCECDTAVNQCVGKACLKRDGQACGLDAECASSSCCGNKCVSRATDLANCGMCGKACGAIADACVGGVCQCGGGAACVAGQRCLGAACVCDNVSCAGCCTGKVCTGAPTAASCGTGGAACKDCNLGAPLGAPFADGCALNGSCSCGGAAPCPSSQTCQGGVCTCTALSCPVGCCAGASCKQGNAKNECGAAGAQCLDCNVAATGTVCQVNGKCGCDTADDCPDVNGGHQACDLATGQCSAKCLVAQAGPCRAGCCNSLNICSSGTTDVQCGNTGQRCVNCVKSGFVCLGGVCQ